jgi:hypothetical protein
MFYQLHKRHTVKGSIVGGRVILFFFIIIGGVGLTSPGHFWPIVQPQMINEGDCGAIGGMKIGMGNRSTRRKPAQRHFVHHKSHLTRLVREHGPPRWEVSDGRVISVYNLYQAFFWAYECITGTKFSMKDKKWRSRGGKYEAYYLLPCDAVWFGRWVLTFRRTLLPPTSGSKNLWETTVPNYTASHPGRQ